MEQEGMGTIYMGQSLIGVLFWPSQANHNAMFGFWQVVTSEKRKKIIFLDLILSWKVGKNIIKIDIFLNYLIFISKK